MNVISIWFGFHNKAIFLVECWENYCAVRKSGVLLCMCVSKPVWHTRYAFIFFFCDSDINIPQRTQFVILELYFFLLFFFALSWKVHNTAEYFHWNALIEMLVKKDSSGEKNRTIPKSVSYVCVSFFFFFASLSVSSIYRNLLETFS